MKLTIYIWARVLVMLFGILAGLITSYAIPSQLSLTFHIVIACLSSFVFTATALFFIDKFTEL